MFEENDIIYYDNVCEQINKLTENKLIIEIELEDLVIGQHVLMIFLPYSQRNIYKLVPKLEKITTIPDNKIFNYNN